MAISAIGVNTDQLRNEHTHQKYVHCRTHKRWHSATPAILALTLDQKFCVPFFQKVCYFKPVKEN
jgi:hypothetical protein